MRLGRCWQSHRSHKPNNPVRNLEDAPIHEVIMFKLFRRQKDETPVISTEEVENEVKDYDVPSFSRWVLNNKNRINDLSLGAFSLIMCNVLIEVSEIVVKQSDKK